MENHKNRPILEKENYRWLEGLQTVHKCCNQKQIITVCDRESDIFEFFYEALELNLSFVVRSASNRILLMEEEKSTLRPYLADLPIRGKSTVNIPAKPGRKARKATVELRYSEVTIKPPQRALTAKQESLSPVRLTAVWVHEFDPPEGCNGLDWVLLTNLPVCCAKDGWLVVSYYRCRWRIECYHRVMKSGCNVENSLLGDYDRLEKLITIKSVIAYRLLWLPHVARSDPTKSCEEILSKEEWQTLDCFLHKRSLPREEPPTAKEAVRMIALIGGFAGRKGDGNPGMTTIWRGWNRLQDLVEMRRCLVSWEILSKVVDLKSELPLQAIDFFA